MFEIRTPENKYDFESWLKVFNDYDTSNASSISQQNLSDLLTVFDRFLEVFPHVHLFWVKYAHFMYSATGDIEDAMKVLQKSLDKSVLRYSVEMWAEYVNFIAQNHGDTDPSKIRSAYAQALDEIGWHFRSGSLWLAAIDFEVSQKRNPFFYYAKALQNPTNELARLNRDLQNYIPKTETAKIVGYNFNMTLSEFIALPDDALGSQVVATEDPQRVKVLTTLSVKFETMAKKCREIMGFESQITRPYFHFKAPDAAQISIWEQYADWAKVNRPTEYVIQVYERAVIPCAHIDAIWLEYAFFLEDNGMIEEARSVYNRIPFDILHRAHTYYLAFEEQYATDRAAELYKPAADSDFVEKIIAAASYHHRNGDTGTAISILNNGITRLLEQQDKQGAGVLNATLVDFQGPTEVIPQSAASIISYTSKADKESANSVYYQAVYSETPEVPFEDRVQIASLYLEYTRVLNVDINFQFDLEFLYSTLRAKLIWHKAYFNQISLIQKHSPETRSEEWEAFQSSIQ